MPATVLNAESEQRSADPKSARKSPVARRRARRSSSYPIQKKPPNPSGPPPSRPNADDADRSIPDFPSVCCCVASRSPAWPCRPFAKNTHARDRTHPDEDDRQSPATPPLAVGPRALLLPGVSPRRRNEAKRLALHAQAARWLPARAHGHRLASPQPAKSHACAGGGDGRGGEGDAAEADAASYQLARSCFSRVFPARARHHLLLRRPPRPQSLVYMNNANACSCSHVTRYTALHS